MIRIFYNKLWQTPCSILFKNISPPTSLFFFFWFTPDDSLTLSWRRPLSYRNQSIDLLGKSMGWCLYDNGFHHERVNRKQQDPITVSLYLTNPFLEYSIISLVWTWEIKEQVFRKIFLNEFFFFFQCEAKYLVSLMWTKLNECRIKECGQKIAELIFEKVHLISKLKFHIFNPMAVIFDLSFRMLSYFRVIHKLQFLIFRKFKSHFVAQSFNIKQALNEK